MMIYGNLVIWFTVGLVLLLLEMSNPGLFFFLSFFIGSLAAGLCATITEFWLIELIVFLIMSALVFYVLQRWVQLHVAPIKQYTNVDALMGKQAMVTRAIKPFTMGQVKLGTELWSARSLDDSSICQGEWIVVIAVQGAHLIVKKIDN